MATIVKHVLTNTNYILLGTGFGAAQSKTANWFFGDLLRHTSESQFPMVCVCDKDRTIGWLESTQVVVESVDGQTVKDAFEAT